jgi:hypothetical protein
MFILFQILSIVISVVMAFTTTQPLVRLMWLIAACISIVAAIINLSD